MLPSGIACAAVGIVSIVFSYLFQGSLFALLLRLAVGALAWLGLFIIFVPETRAILSNFIRDTLGGKKVRLPSKMD